MDVICCHYFLGFFIYHFSCMLMIKSILNIHKYCEIYIKFNAKGYIYLYIYSYYIYIQAVYFFFVSFLCVKTNNFILSFKYIKINNV